MGISAINSKQIQVKFSKPLDFESVVDDNGTSTSTDDKAQTGVFKLVESVSTGNTNATDLNDAHASLSKDGMTLTLTVDSTDIVEGTYAFTIDDTVVTADGKESLNSYAVKLVVAKDTTAPTVKALTFNPHTNQFTVELSEPVQVAPVIVVDGSAPISGTAVLSSVNNTRFVYTNTDEQGKTVSVRVSGAADYKNNVMTTYTQSVKINREEEELKVNSIEQLDSNMALVVFDKPVPAANINAALTALRDGDPLPITATKYAPDSSGRSFLVTFTSGTAPNYEVYSEGKSTAKVSLVFAKDSIIDIYGNTNAEIIKTVTMTKDTNAPVITNQLLTVAGTALELRFDEYVDKVGSDLVDIQIRRDGVDVTAEFDAATADGTKKVLTFVTASVTKVIDGNYTILIPAATIKDGHDNENKSITSKVINVINNQTVDQTVATIAQGGTNVFEVSFVDATPNPVKVGNSALNLSAYSLDGVALPEGTDIVFDDVTKTKVIITLPNNSVNYSSASSTLRVINVIDADGIKVAPTSNTVTVTDNVAPEVKSVSLTGNTLTLTFSENINATEVVAITDLAELNAEFEIKGGAVKLTDGTNSSVVSSVDGKVVTFTITGGDSNWETIKLSSKLTVKQLAGTIEDLNSVAMKASNTVISVVKK